MKDEFDDYSVNVDSDCISDDFDDYDLYEERIDETNDIDNFGDDLRFE